MNVHENVILDLLPAVRSGQASTESRQLVEQYLEANPQIARFAALMPTPDPALELRALQRTRQELGRASWLKGLAIFFTLLPLSFVKHGDGVRFMFAEYPAMMSVMVVVAAALWISIYFYGKRSQALR
jgi:hypothetical protein